MTEQITYTGTCRYCDKSVAREIKSAIPPDPKRIRCANCQTINYIESQKP